MATNFANKLTPGVGLVHSEPGSDNWDKNLFKDHYIKDWVLSALNSGGGLISGEFNQDDSKITGVEVIYFNGDQKEVLEFSDKEVVVPTSGRFIYYASKVWGDIKVVELPEFSSLTQDGFVLSEGDFPLLHVGVYHKLGTTNDVFYKWIAPYYHDQRYFKSIDCQEIQFVKEGEGNVFSSMASLSAADDSGGGSVSIKTKSSNLEFKEAVFVDSSQRIGIGGVIPTCSFQVKDSFYVDSDARQVYVGGFSGYDQDFSLYISSNAKSNLVLDSGDGESSALLFGHQGVSKSLISCDSDANLSIIDSASNEEIISFSKESVAVKNVLSLASKSTLDVDSLLVSVPDGSQVYDQDKKGQVVKVNGKKEYLQTKSSVHIGFMYQFVGKDWQKYNPGNSSAYLLDDLADGWVLAEGFKVTSQSYSSYLTAGDDYHLIISDDDYALAYDAIAKDVYGVGTVASDNSGRMLWFSLIDMRGQFARGWDHGAGVDVDERLLGDVQDDSMQGHGHYLGSQDSSTGHSTSSSMEFIRSYNSGNGPKANSSPPQETEVYGEPRVSLETRPKNRSVVYLVKIKA